MKKIFIIVLAVAALGFASCQTNTTKEGGSTTETTKKPGKKITTQSDSLSYALGVVWGSQWQDFKKNVGDDLKMEMFLSAFRDVDNDKFTLDLEQANSYLQNYFSFVLPEKMKKDNADFLANVEKTTPNVKKTESGLLYDILEPGSSKKPTSLEDTVKVNYKGEFKDGEVFDESTSPIEFKLNQVIKGWGEGMQLIGEGGKIRLWIPYDLGYGEQGHYSIPPYAALVFEVELLEVNPAQ